MRYSIPTRLATFLILAGLLASSSFAQPADMADLDAISGAGLEFVDLQPEGFDAGMKFAAIHGDPSVPDQPYVIRLSFPDGYRFPAHYHPNAENLTVMSGTFLLAMGTDADESQLKSYSPGDFLYLPATHPHYGGAKGETVIQLHGMGPFEVMLAK